MNRLDSEKKARVISCLIEGCSIRSTVRMIGVTMKTVMRVLVEVGEVCADYQARAFRDLYCATRVKPPFYYTFRPAPRGPSK
jgi:hypothetical protein